MLSDLNNDKEFLRIKLLGLIKRLENLVDK